MTMSELKSMVYEHYRKVKNTVALVGMPGAGKSTAADVLDEAGMYVLDVDKEIADQEGMELPEIVSKYGAGYFAGIERTVIRQSMDWSEIMIALLDLGGRAFLHDKTRTELLNEDSLNGCIVVFLDMDIKVLEQRMEDTSGDLAKLYKERLPIYEQAQIRIRLNGYESPEEVASKILTNVLEYAEKGEDK